MSIFRQITYLASLLVISLSANLATAGCRLLDWSIPIQNNPYRLTERGKEVARQKRSDVIVIMALVLAVVVLHFFM
jgi:hypothetical protein